MLLGFSVSLTLVRCGFTLWPYFGEFVEIVVLKTLPWARDVFLLQFALFRVYYLCLSL